MRTPAMAVAAMAALGLGLAGCEAGTGGTAGEPTPSDTPTATASPADGAAAQCMVGTWRSTGATGSARTSGASADLSGGSGVAVTIAADGAVTLDFASMQPVDFTSQVAGTEVAGEFVYGGRATGTIRTDEGTASASPAATAGTATASPSANAGTTTASPGAGAATEGDVRPVPPIEWGDVRVTVDLTAPVKARPFDDVRLGDYVGDGVGQTGNVVDVHPFLGEGRYRCRGDTLVLSPADDSGLTWTLTKA
ncbi:hypothetical protein WEI85_42340 [Actinomycetes bacterium KLBMP 9797]